MNDKETLILEAKETLDKLMSDEIILTREEASKIYGKLIGNILNEYLIESYPKEWEIYPEWRATEEDGKEIIKSYLVKIYQR